MLVSVVMNNSMDSFFILDVQTREKTSVHPPHSLSPLCPLLVPLRTRTSPMHPQSCHDNGQYFQVRTMCHMIFRCRDHCVVFSHLFHIVRLFCHYYPEQCVCIYDHGVLVRGFLDWIFLGFAIK